MIFAEGRDLLAEGFGVMGDLLANGSRDRIFGMSSAPSGSRKEVWEMAAEWKTTKHNDSPRKCKSEDSSDGKANFESIWLSTGFAGRRSEDCSAASRTALCGLGQHTVLLINLSYSGLFYACEMTARSAAQASISDAGLTIRSRCSRASMHRLMALTNEFESRDIKCPY